MSNWSVDILQPEPFDKIGASSITSNENVYIIGGYGNGASNNNNNNNKQKASPYLSIISFNYKTVNWMPTLMNSNGIVNKAYHSSILLESEIYIFGGRNTVNMPNSNLLSSDIIKISDTDFGLSSSIVMEDKNTARQGLTTTVVSSDANQVAIYGGFTVDYSDKSKAPVTSFPTDLFLFKKKEVPVDQVVDIDENKWEIVAVKTNGEVPPARAYHSSIVAGNSNQYVIIFGGQSGEKNQRLLKDVWVCDLSTILEKKAAPVVEIEDPKAKKGKPKPGKGVVEEVEPMAIWTQLIDTPNMIPRKLHMSFLYTDSSTNEVKFCVFGGQSKDKTLSCSSNWTSIIDIDDGKLTASEFEQSNNCIDNVGNEISERFGTSYAPIFDKNSSPNSPVAIMIFGGTSVVSEKNTKESKVASNSIIENSFASGSAINSSIYNKTSSLYMIIDESSEIIVNLKKDVAKACGIVDEIFDKGPDRVEYYDGNIYVGELINDPSDINVDVEIVDLTKKIRHGKGIMTYKISGDEYEGDWNNNLKHGMGVLRYSNGSEYFGAFINDLICGKGTLKSSSNEIIYNGDFANGLYHGNGIIIEDNGDKYEGEFLNGIKEGNGKLTIKSSGSVIKGKFSKNILISGSTDSKPIESFNGQFGSIKNNISWSDSIINAKSSIKGIYSGSLINGLPSGIDGICIYEDKSEYKGGWKSGRRNGVGTLIYANMDKYEGKWVNDKRCGRGKWISQLTKESYDGNWSDHVPNGQGTYKYSDNSIYTGEFINGDRSGQGNWVADTQSQRNKSLEVSYQGDWAFGFRNGYGISIDGYGEKFEGKFVDDKPIRI